ncbi:MAG TPA: hypothetical protein VKG62_06480, partial [Solirubrobacteraceae bacterium]|nr:hypothetical protein [Solirubrobacteraceae bacterium]
TALIVALEELPPEEAEGFAPQPAAMRVGTTAAADAASSLRAGMGAKKGLMIDSMWWIANRLHHTLL